jgi:hypothetical protein
MLYFPSIILVTTPDGFASSISYTPFEGAESAEVVKADAASAIVPAVPPREIPEFSVVNVRTGSVSYVGRNFARAVYEVRLIADPAVS